MMKEMIIDNCGEVHNYWVGLRTNRARKNIPEESYPVVACREPLNGMPQAVRPLDGHFFQSKRLTQVVVQEVGHLLSPAVQSLRVHKEQFKTQHFYLLQWLETDAAST